MDTYQKTLDEEKKMQNYKCQRRTRGFFDPRKKNTKNK